MWRPTRRPLLYKSRFVCSQGASTLTCGQSTSHPSHPKIYRTQVESAYPLTPFWFQRAHPNVLCSLLLPCLQCRCIASAVGTNGPSPVTPKRRIFCGSDCTPQKLQRSGTSDVFPSGRELSKSGPIRSCKSPKVSKCLAICGSEFFNWSSCCPSDVACHHADADWESGPRIAPASAEVYVIQAKHGHRSFAFQAHPSTLWTSC